MSVTLRLILVAAAMTVFLAGMVAHHVWQRASGAEIVLPLEPLDPRDLLLGHYVVAATPAHRIDLRNVGGESQRPWRRGDDVFVTVEADADGFWRPTAVYPRRPRGAGVHLRGKTPGASPRRDWTGGAEWTELRVNYRIERYFAPPDHARELERLTGEARLGLIVAVGGRGDTVIKGLMIDGEPRYDSLFR